MRHIITGGSGFTGKVLTRQLLSAGEKVVHFDMRPPSTHDAIPSVSWVQGDVRSIADLRRLALSPGDIVHHLAARQFADAVPRHGRDEWFEEVNVAGTSNVVQVMQEAGSTKLIFFSTDMTYGSPGICPIPPNCSQTPLGPYGRSKLKAEKVLLGAEGINSTIFRPRLITGYGRLGILGKLFSLIKKGLPVPMIGNGHNRYQMVSVEDCARAAILAAEKGCPSGPFNLGSENPPTTRELLNGIIRYAGSRSFVMPTPAAPLKLLLGLLDRTGLTLLFPEQFGIADADILLDTTTTRDELGWAPAMDDIDMMNAAYKAFLGTEN